MPRVPCRSALVALSLVLAAAAAAASAAGAAPRELLLAGGALGVCSDLAPSACRAPPVGSPRQPARFRLDDAGIARALDPALWSASGAPPREALAAMLAAARETLAATHAAAGGADAGIDAADLEDALFDTCLAAQCVENDPQRPWSVLLDAERGAVLAALEVPQRKVDGTRPTERAHPDESRHDGGVAVLRAFVDAAAARAPGRPRIAVVTAASFDPMEAVDFYLDVFRDLGADAMWWPVDGASSAARFERGDCAALPALRLERLGLTNREVVYPDLADFQRGFCASQPALMLQVQGVFFAGGDQWKHRQAFVHSDGRANDWLLELQQAHAAGRVVVGGTSAGAAVQSGAWMLGNGDVEAAVSRAARVAAPPQSGCSRGGRCGGLPEDALTLWPAGGLRLADDAIVDTHFSERARELRLLMAMQAADARWGYGADEASALRVRQFADRREIDALGASGGWVFRRDPALRDEVEAWYLAPGATLVIERGLAADAAGSDAFGERVRLVLAQGVGRAERLRSERPATAFAAGALRTMAQRLAWRCGRGYTLPAVPGSAELACADGARGWRSVNGMHGVGPLRLRFVRAVAP